MAAAADHVADGVVGAAPVNARPWYVAIVEGVNPLLTPVAECRVEAAHREARSAVDAVIAAAGQAPSGAVIHVIAQIHAVVVRAETRHGGRRFDVVDTAPVPIVGAADQDAGALVTTE